MPRLSKVVLLLGLCCCFTITPAFSEIQAEDPAKEEDIPQTNPVAELHAFLSGFQSIKATFLQRGGRLEEAPTEGAFWLAKPDTFRVETGPPISQVIVSDGTDLWTHDVDLEQVVISPLSRDAETMPILLLAAEAQEIDETFLVDVFEDEHKQVFALTPRNESSIIRQVTLVVAEGLPAGIGLETTTSERSYIELAEVEFDPEMADDVFVFALPEGVDVIDDRPGD